MSEADFNDLIAATSANAPKNIFELINKVHKKSVEEMLKILRAVRDDKKIDREKMAAFLEKVDVDPYEMAREFLKDEISSSQKAGNAGVRKIPIRATTIQSSKGLAADYVFITNFDDQYFIKNKDKKKITDQDICSFLVALTRAKKKVFLISSNIKKEPVFKKWINSGRIEKIS